jgi:hypothetical protein
MGEVIAFKHPDSEKMEELRAKLAAAMEEHHKEMSRPPEAEQGIEATEDYTAWQRSLIHLDVTTAAMLALRGKTCTIYALKRVVERIEEEARKEMRSVNPWWVFPPFLPR